MKRFLGTIICASVLALALPIATDARPPRSVPSVDPGVHRSFTRGTPRYNNYPSNYPRYNSSFYEQRYKRGYRPGYEQRRRDNYQPYYHQNSRQYNRYYRQERGRVGFEIYYQQ